MKIWISMQNFDCQFRNLHIKIKIECQYEELDTYKSSTEFYESFQTKCKALSLWETKDLLKARCNGFAKLVQYLNLV